MSKRFVDQTVIIIWAVDFMFKMKQSQGSQRLGQKSIVMHQFPSKEQ